MSSFPWDYAEGDGSHNPRATVVQVESSKLLPAIILLASVGIAGVVGAFVAWYQARDARTEARMAEYYITRLDALLVEQGIKKAGDDFEKFKQETKE